jgi:H+/Cl- antiporter ClcA
MSAPEEMTVEQADALVRSRQFIALLLLAAVVGLLVSLAAWCFLEGTFQLQHELFVRLPPDLGYDDGPPLWYLLAVLGIAGVIVAFAIVRLPGRGGHVPVHGFSAGGPVTPIDLPGVLLAAVGTIGFGLVLGPEAPLIALGAGLAMFTVRLTRREVPQEGLLVVAAAGSFAAVSFIFSSPLIAAVLLIEATAVGGVRQRLVLVPGLMAAGIGSLSSIGIGSVTGLSTSDYALGALPLPGFAEPTVAEFAWTIALAIVVAVAIQVIVRLGHATERVATPRPFIALPLIGLIVAALAYAFGQITDQPAVAVLLSGQDALPHLVSDAGSWSLSALTWLTVFKGIAYGLSLGSFRGGPTFPALFLGAAAGVMASHLPGLAVTPGVAVCMAAATVSMLRLPLSAVMLASLLTAPAGSGSGPLIIVAVVVAYIATLGLTRPAGETEAPEVPVAAAGAPAA